MNSAMTTVIKTGKNVYRVLNYYKDFKQIMAGTPYVLASALKDEFPQVIKAVNARPVSLQLKDKERNQSV